MISVCMATYNGEKYIKEQVNSILSQLGEQDEIIVSDDGSTDNTISILTSYKDRRIHVYDHKKKKKKDCVGDVVSANFEHGHRSAGGTT